MFTEKTYFIRKKVIIDQMGRNSIRFRQFMEQGGIRLNRQGTESTGKILGKSFC